MLTVPSGRELARAVQRAERTAVATALNLLEDGRPAARSESDALLAALPLDGLRTAGHLVGLTGPPGVGKSSIAAALIGAWRAGGRTVGVLAVDPSSPLSGGALLGDRLRMLQPRPDDGLFIRSLAGRGELGGISKHVFPMSRVMLAAFDVVLVETIGVGQTEVDVITHTDTTCLLAQPASGDTIQYLKAGIMELPAIVAVNKADLGEVADRAATELRACLPPPATNDPAVPVLLVSARARQGIDELVQAFDEHRSWLEQRERLEAAREAQAVAWALKSLFVEFGHHGVNLLGGEVEVRRSWMATTDSPFVKLEALRQHCRERCSESATA